MSADPKRLASWERLAAVTERLEGPSAAEAVFRELIQAWPKSPAAHISYSAHIARTGRPDEAIAYLEQVIGDGLDEPLLWEQQVRLEIAERRVRERARIWTSRESATPATR